MGAAALRASARLIRIQRAVGAIKIRQMSYFRLSKKSIDFSDSLPNVSIFGPRSGPKICRCAAQTPANAGFLQTFDSIRRGSRPLVLPLQKRTSFLQTGDFRQAERTPEGVLSAFFRGTSPAPGICGAAPSVPAGPPMAAGDWTPDTAAD